MTVIGNRLNIRKIEDDTVVIDLHLSPDATVELVQYLVREFPGIVEDTMNERR